LIAQVCNRAILIADGELIVDDDVRNLLTGSTTFAPTVAKLFPNQKWLTVNDVLEAQVS
jgi:energy-coupling factor transport system ATP-binding protein